MSYRLNIIVPSLDHPYCLAEFNVEMPGDLEERGPATVTVGGIALEVINVKWETDSRARDLNAMRMVTDAFDTDPRLKLEVRERRRREGLRCYVQARVEPIHLLTVAAAVMKLDKAAAEAKP